jgi:hypothetical protein
MSKHIPRQMPGLSVKTSRYHPGTVRQSDDGLAKPTISPANRWGDVKNRCQPAEHRKCQDWPAASIAEKKTDCERSEKGDNAQPENRIRDCRQIGRVENAICAQTGVEVFVKRLDTDYCQRHAEKSAPENGRVELVRHAVCPGGAEQVGHKARIQEKSVAYEFDHAQQTAHR